MILTWSKNHHHHPRSWNQNSPPLLVDWLKWAWLSWLEELLSTTFILASQMSSPHCCPTCVHKESDQASGSNNEQRTLKHTKWNKEKHKFYYFCSSLKYLVHYTPVWNYWAIKKVSADLCVILFFICVVILMHRFKATFFSLKNPETFSYNTFKVHSLQYRNLGWQWIEMNKFIPMQMTDFLKLYYYSLFFLLLTDFLDCWISTRKTVRKRSYSHHILSYNCRVWVRCG